MQGSPAAPQWSQLPGGVGRGRQSAWRAIIPHIHWHLFLILPGFAFLLPSAHTLSSASRAAASLAKFCPPPASPTKGQHSPWPAQHPGLCVPWGHCWHPGSLQGSGGTRHPHTPQQQQCEHRAVPALPRRTPAAPTSPRSADFPLPTHQILPGAKDLRAAGALGGIIVLETARRHAQHRLGVHMAVSERLSAARSLK